MKQIEDYGVVGNMSTAALVGLDSSVDFFCFPRFDSPTIFAALLDNEKGGCYSVIPEMTNMVCKQMYVAETNVLITRFLCGELSAEVTDFMPVTAQDQRNVLIRVARSIHGTVRFLLQCRPGFDYARVNHTACLQTSDVLFVPDSGDCEVLRLQGSQHLTVDNGTASANFILKKGECATFILGADSELTYTSLNQDVTERELAETLRYWREWSGKSQYRGRWREAVSRSALVLKLLTSKQYGSLIAAPTFSLPEVPGGERNWDYRYTWLRDTAFTLYAFMRLGYHTEADQFFAWLSARIRESDGSVGPMRIMYRLDGSTDLEEVDLDHLRGYMDSRPVRMGNGAHDQSQLDIYGEIFDATYLYSKYGHALPYEGWVNVKAILAWLGENWRKPDDGIWELRGGDKELLHSRLMCWVAFDRAIRLAHKRSLSAQLAEWYRHRDDIVDDIYANFWSEKRQSFVQAKGSETMDASILLLPLMRFISPIDPKWLSTLAAIELDLAEDAFVYRYRNREVQDGLGGEEGSFTCCSFWFVECLARANQVDKARLLFEKLLAHGNHLGLFSEQMSRSGRQLGNFPQALTHLALISAATYLDRALSKTDPTAWA